MTSDILGFDCEWTKDGPVSLLQLAAHNEISGIAVLLRLNKIGFVPTKLRVISIFFHVKFLF